MSIFNKLKHNLDISNDQKILDFYEYLEKNYIGHQMEVVKGRGNNKKTCIETIEPRYYIALWSVHSRIKEKLSRTNNFCEGWHNGFHTMLGNHPLVYELVNFQLSLIFYLYFNQYT